MLNWYQKVAYPAFIIKSAQQYLYYSLAGYDKSTAPLDNGNIVSMFVVVLSNILRGITGANNNCFLALSIYFWRSKSARVHEAVALEIVYSLNIIRNVWNSGVAGSLDNMPGVECAC